MVVLVVALVLLLVLPGEVGRHGCCCGGCKGVAGGHRVAVVHLLLQQQHARKEMCAGKLAHRCEGQKSSST